MLQNKRLCDWRKQHAVELEVVLSAVGGIMQQNNRLCGGWRGPDGEQISGYIYRQESCSYSRNVHHAGDRERADRKAVQD